MNNNPILDALNLVDQVFHRIVKILPKGQEPKTISPETTASEALDIMNTLGFSQLPVVTSSNEVLGVFSYRSFATNAAQFSREDVNNNRCAPGDIMVDYYLEPLKFVQLDDDLQSVLETITTDDAVLIGSAKKLEGILTPADFLSYLHRVAAPFVILSEIELSLRGLILITASEEQLAEALANNFQEGLGGRTPCSLTELTFNDYITLLESDKFDDLPLSCKPHGFRPFPVDS